MFRRAYEFVMLSTIGVVKVSLFVLLFLISMFLILKSGELKVAGTTAFTSFLTKPEISEAVVTQYDSLTENNSEILGEITAEEAEIFLFILRFSDSMAPNEARKLASLITEECDKYDLDPYLILALIQIESSFIPKAVSGKGAVGLMQVMPSTGKFLAKELGISYNGKSTLYDPYINVRLGIHYLSFLADRFESTENALAAYNYGPTKFENSEKLKKTPPKYVKKVLDFKDFLEEESIILAKSI